MEFVTIFTYFGIYTKVYDSKEKYDNNECIDLLFMDRLPLFILFKIYKNVNFNNKNNILYYTQILNFLNKFKDNQTEYIIYIDNWGMF